MDEPVVDPAAPAALAFAAGCRLEVWLTAAAVMAAALCRADAMMDFALLLALDVVEDTIERPVDCAWRTIAVACVCALATSCSASDGA